VPCRIFTQNIRLCTSNFRAEFQSNPTSETSPEQFTLMLNQLQSGLDFSSSSRVRYLDTAEWFDLPVSLGKKVAVIIGASPMRLLSLTQREYVVAMVKAGTPPRGSKLNIYTNSILILSGPAMSRYLRLIKGTFAALPYFDDKRHTLC
jgi:hypothetical protein